MSSGQYLWWQSGTIYQIYPRSFKDSNADGIGDLAGIIEKLDYLEWLGVDCIWLSPFYPSPMADFGYDVADYVNVDPIFGDLAAFDQLVTQAQTHNIRIIVDFVPNHSSDEHEWFKESRSSRHNLKRDWYIWRDPLPNGQPPNNWLSNFGGSAWEFDSTTGQYYLHLFHTKQPDLNWRNPEVRQAMYGALRFWLERGVAGFRIDVLPLLIKNEQLLDNPLNPDWKEGDHFSHKHHKIHTEDQPEIHQIVQEMRQLAEEYPEKVLIGETYLPYPKLVTYYGQKLDEAHLPFNFELAMIPEWQASRVKAIVDAYEATLPEGAWPNWVLGNHDQPRIATRVGQAHARLAQMLLLTLRGTPTMYYADELGMENVPIPPELARDPEEVGSPGFGRDPERTPMQWDDSPNAGFCPPEAIPWLPIASNYQQLNMSAEQKDGSSILNLVHSLLELRRATPALNIGDYHPVNEIPSTCFAFLREFEGQRLLVALNFSDQPQPLILPALGRGTVLLSTLLDRNEEVDLTSLNLRPTEGLILRL